VESAELVIGPTGLDLEDNPEASKELAPKGHTT
jgi:hypothetical protein